MQTTCCGLPALTTHSADEVPMRCRWGAVLDRWVSPTVQRGVASPDVVYDLKRGVVNW